ELGDYLAAHGVGSDWAATPDDLSGATGPDVYGGPSTDSASSSSSNGPTLRVAKFTTEADARARAQLISAGPTKSLGKHLRGLQCGALVFTVVNVPPPTATPADNDKLVKD